MAISIINNIPALGAQRQLNQINQNLSKTIFRLSSGLRINTAADDAAGLAISERLRARISSLGQGTLNAQDAISVLQTADGALNEATQVLQRLRVLAQNAASAAKNDTDRAQLQVEVDQLLEELDRLASTTKFSDVVLLDGAIKPSNNGNPSKVAISANSFIGIQATPLVASVAIENPESLFSLGNETFILQVVGGIGPNIYSVNIYSSLSADSTVPLASASFGGDDPRSIISIDISTGVSAGGSFAIVINNTGMSFAQNQIGKTAFVTTSAAQITSTTDNSLLVQIGTEVGDIIKVFAPSVKTKDLFFGEPLKVTTVFKAEGAIHQIDQALDVVVSGRATLGALHNRFDGTIRNNDIFRENITASESRIRDLNIATETSNFTKNQILLQSSTAFLAQANLIPQSLLQLFR